MNVINSPGYLPVLAPDFHWDYGFTTNSPGYIYLKIMQNAPVGTQTWARREVMAGFGRDETRKRLINTAWEMADKWAPWNPVFHEEITLGVFDNLEAPEDERK